MKVLILVFALCTSFIASAVEINVGGNNVRAKPIAVVPFDGNIGSDKVDFVISADLKQSGLFAPISPNMYGDRPSLTDTVNYAKFRQLGVPYVVIGELKDVGGASVLRFALLDSYQEKLLASYTIQSKEGVSLRMQAHKASDLILQKLNGIRGAFASKIVYVYESGKNDTRRYQIMISDSDGVAGKVLATSKLPLMSPRISPDMSSVAYVSFEGGQSHIVVLDVNTLKKTTVSSEAGINSSPSWSPDGKHLAMVLSKDGNPEIYIKDLTSNILTRVTDNRFIDTQPVWADNSNSLFFTSDRDGSPQLYRINISTGQISKVNIAGKYNADAYVSRDGKKVAFSHDGGIAVVNLLDNNLSVVSKGSIDDTPKFSPNGQMLIFTSIKENRQVLKIVNIDGTGEIVLSAAGQVRDPDWSGYVL